MPIFQAFTEYETWEISFYYAGFEPSLEKKRLNFSLRSVWCSYYSDFIEICVFQAFKFSFLPKSCLPISSMIVVVLVAQSCPTLCDPQTVACQVTLFMKFSREVYWSGLPFPSPLL